MLTVLLLLASASAYRLTPGTSRFDWYREAEKKHARVALLAAPSLAILSAVTPHPVQWLNEQPVETQLTFYSVAAVLETVNLRRIERGIKLRDGETPGRVFPFLPEPSETLDALEDGAGRVAMLACAMVLAAQA